MIHAIAEKLAELEDMVDPRQGAAYREGLADAYKLIAEFPGVYTAYRVGSGLNGPAIANAIQSQGLTGLVVGVEQLEDDLAIKEVSANQFRADLCHQLRMILWPTRNETEPKKEE